MLNPLVRATDIQVPDVAKMSELVELLGQQLTSFQASDLKYLVELCEELDRKAWELDAGARGAIMLALAAGLGASGNGRQREFWEAGMSVRAAA